MGLCREEEPEEPEVPETTTKAETVVHIPGFGDIDMTMGMGGVRRKRSVDIMPTDRCVEHQDAITSCTYQYGKKYDNVEIIS